MAWRGWNVSWLDSLTPEADIKSQQDRLQFTSEPPPPHKLINISYGQGAALCYSTAVVIMLIFLISRLWRMTSRLQLNVGSGGAARFFVRQLPLTLGVSAWSGFLLGSALTAILSAVMWLTS